MPNALYGLPLYDPIEVRTNRARFRRHAIPELAYANSFFAPGGEWPARGWVLMRQGDYANIDTYSKDLILQFEDVQSQTSITLNGLTVVQARCVSTGVVNDPNAIYLVELTDVRGILVNQWFEFPVQPFDEGGDYTAYNVVAPAYPGQYYTPTMDGASAFTWDGMLDDLWTQMEGFLGTYPGIPIGPQGTPENFWFQGTSAWKALMRILDLLGLTIAVDLRSATPYSIVQSAGTDVPFTTLQNASATLLEDDQAYIDTGSGRVPGQVVVLFHRRNEFYGNEETVTLDEFQWATRSYYPITVEAPAQFTAAQGTHYFYDDFTVRYDQDSMPIASDVMMATTIANERVAQYYDHIYSSTVGFLDQTYTGIIPFSAGSQIDGVRWYQDYSLGRGSWRTQIVRGMNPPWANVIAMQGKDA
jgi:hypothetical protein